MKYTSQNKNRQLTLDIFRSSLDSLDKSNRWVILGDTLPWAELEKVYNSNLNNSYHLRLVPLFYKNRTAG